MLKHTSVHDLEFILWSQIIKLLAKLRIVKLKEERKEREEKKRKRSDASSPKQEVLPTAKHDPALPIGFREV